METGAESRREEWSNLSKHQFEFGYGQRAEWDGTAEKQTEIGKIESFCLTDHNED